MRLRCASCSLTKLCRPTAKVYFVSDSMNVEAKATSPNAVMKL